MENEAASEFIETEVTQTSGQIQPKSFIYKITLPEKSVYVTVIAINNTSARAGIAQRFPNMSVSYLGTCSEIIQVNG